MHYSRAGEDLLTLAQVIAGAAVEVFLFAVAGGILYRVWARFLPIPRRQNVLAFQRGVVLRGDKVEKVVGPGSHRIAPNRTMILCDMRVKPFQIPPQELLTADAVGIRIGLGGEWQVVDAALFTTGSSEAFGSLYLELRHALRVSVGEHTKATILCDPSSIIPRMKELLVPRATQLGVALAQLDVLDIVLSG